MPTPTTKYYTFLVPPVAPRPAKRPWFRVMSTWAMIMFPGGDLHRFTADSRNGFPKVHKSVVSVAPLALPETGPLLTMTMVTQSDLFGYGNAVRTERPSRHQLCIALPFSLRRITTLLVNMFYTAIYTCYKKSRTFLFNLFETPAYYSVVAKNAASLPYTFSNSSLLSWTFKSARAAAHP